MDHTTLVKQVFDLHRNTFEGLYKGIVTLQDQAEKTVAPLIEGVPWITEEGRNAVNEWRKLYRKGRDDFKRAVDDGYDKLETYLSPMAAQTKAKGEAAKK